MSIATLEKKFAQLPEEKQKEVEHLIEELLQKVKQAAEAKAGKPKPMFGSLKGMFVMADDFDEPLEDFKDYM